MYELNCLLTSLNLLSKYFIYFHIVYGKVPFQVLWQKIFFRAHNNSLPEFFFPQRTTQPSKSIHPSSLELQSKLIYSDQHFKRIVFISLELGKYSIVFRNEVHQKCIYFVSNFCVLKFFQLMLTLLVYIWINFLSYWNKIRCTVSLLVTEK